METECVYCEVGTELLSTVLLTQTSGFKERDREREREKERERNEKTNYNFGTRKHL
jgi:hypothetical protein